MEQQLPYATEDIPAVPGTIKARYEDFKVDEIPAYEPRGSGDHVYFRIEKSGLSTPRAVRDIARALGVRPGSIGVAGMKDARGVTTQMLSVEHVDPSSVQALHIPRINVLEVGRHRNKLKMGHLRGNRFTIKMRDTEPERLVDVLSILDVLASRGVPNYFGSQRFGSRGDTWKIGRALLMGNFDVAAEVIAGRAGPDDTGDVLRARELFDAGQFAESARVWPRGYGECASLCRAMDRFGLDKKRAVLSLDRRTLKLYVSACQSWLFNTILAKRIDGFDVVENGDVAWKHDSGAVFLVESESDDLPRAMNFEISPTGPLYGPKMKQTQGRILKLEQGVLEKAGLTMEHFSQSGPLKCPGGRRSFRFRPEGSAAQTGEDEHGQYVEIEFVLPSGCYATAVLCEICKERLIQVERISTSSS
ncbi:MAG: tRNA pseudouridine(13) synthase TruD [Deltaproteobacteria bacterium]|nr:tRNA pseudouridine(13) synthase TruD [Deltaproteobacteria bacterium]